MVNSTFVLIFIVLKYYAFHIFILIVRSFNVQRTLFYKICYKHGDTIIYNFLKPLGCILLDANTLDCM